MIMSSASFSFFFFLSSLPFSIFCQDEDYRYADCSKSFGFNCGPVKKIDYPFWSSTRSNYCGHPKFKLECIENTPLIKIMSETYRVLEINQDNQTLKIIRRDSWDNNCPRQPIYGNTTFNDPLYTPVNRMIGNVALFYDCPPLSSVVPNKFSCPINGTENSAAIPTWLTPVAAYPELWTCKIHIIVPDFETSGSSFDLTDWKMQEVVEAGFELKYIVDELACNECEKSGGRCGHDFSTPQQFTCFCRQGPMPQTFTNSLAPKPIYHFISVRLKT